MGKAQSLNLEPQMSLSAVDMPIKLNFVRVSIELRSQTMDVAFS